ncbi:MAG: sugar phosphate nucleotidyltransferase, partial [Methylococcales bacterium]|nr:sugar phosphate nucleotidyltransferase [Methylococcales bacterium]
LKQMVAQYHKNQCSILGVERVNPSETDKYGIVKTKELTPNLGQVELIVEKPSPDRAPSSLGVVGRYILTSAIFRKIEETGKGAGGEIQLTDAIAALMLDQNVFAYEFEGKRYDCGSKLGYLQATVEEALVHDELRDDFLAYLKDFVANLPA